MADLPILVLDLATLPVHGLWSFLANAQKHFRVHVHTARTPQEDLLNQLQQHARDDRVKQHLISRLHFSDSVSDAHIILSDRAITFLDAYPPITRLLNFVRERA
jgi:hypothetical protein